MRWVVWVLFASVGACSGVGTQADAGLTPGVDAGGATPQDASAVDASGVDAAMSSSDLGAQTPSVAECPVAPMDQLYSGALPPNPYGTLPAASACVDAPHDVLIVLGCPNNSDGSPANCQIARANLAVSFFNAGYASHIITTGAAVQNANVEAVTLKQLLVDRGIPATAILTEQRAAHTDENLYFSTRIMESNAWQSAIVISDDAGQLLFSATCDSNCCVSLGRLTALGFTVAGNVIKAAHYARYPWAQAVVESECAQIQMPLKLMCSNLASRLACAGNVQVGDALDAGD